MISDTDAQRTAGDWHGGGGSALYVFASTGAIVPGLQAEILECLRGGVDDHDRARLGELEEYRRRTGPRGPVNDWYARVISG